MSQFKTYLSKHPLLSMLVFNLAAIPLSVAVGYGVSQYFKFQFGWVLFIESLLVLVLCSSAVSGNSGNYQDFGRKVDTQDSTHYFGAYHFAIKYGILGVSLFVLSGVFGMK